MSMTQVSSDISWQKIHIVPHSPLLCLSSNIAQETEERVANLFWTSETLEDLPFRLGKYPLWPTKEHIDTMVQSGVLKSENIFIGADRWREFVQNEQIPQVFGYTIANITKLSEVTPAWLALRIFNDEETLKRVLGYLESWGDITMYVGNERFLDEWTKYLGPTKRRPSQDEQIAIWKKVPWRDFYEKMKNLWIPFVGCFDPNDCSFFGVGSVVYMQVKWDELSFDNNLKSVYDTFYSPEYGSSTFVIEDK